MISKSEETTDIIEAIESNKGFMIKDNDSRQELKIRGFGEGKKHGLLLRDYEALYLIYSSKLNVIKDKKKLSFNDFNTKKSASVPLAQDMQNFVFV